jgi:60 kDa SS-A/Ro ribonucleoprotein
MKYNTYFKQKPTQTSQRAPIPGKHMVRNSNDGYSFAVDEWKRLQRFLVLGTAGGSFYASEQTLTIENANSVLDCIRMDGLRVVRETVTVSDEGHAPKNDPAIFVLALAAAKGDEATRRAAFEALPKVCRTGTHLFQFAEYVQTFRGWGRGLRRGVASWYTAQTLRNLAYQAVKYRQRDGWTHADLLRLAHPKPGGEAQGALFNWMTRPEEAGWARDLRQPEDEALAFVWAFERAQAAQDVETVLKLIQDYDLPREALPTQWLNEPSVWAALLAKMPMTAMLRNLGVMARIELLTPFSAAEATIVERLGNAELLRKARVHPIAVLSALRVYAQGRGMRSDATWKPTARVVDALDSAFYLAFKNVEPANKRLKRGAGAGDGAHRASVHDHLLPGQDRAAEHLGQDAAGRCYQGDQQPALRGDGLRSADAVRAGQEAEGGYVRDFHGFGDMVRRRTPSGSTVEVPSGNRHSGAACRGRNDRQPVYYRRPGRCRNA